MHAKHFVLGALALAVSAPVLAHDRDEHQAEMKVEKLPRADVDMIKKLHQANREEIELGLVAQQVSMREDVKEFAKMMVDDHRAADEKIVKMGTDHGIPLGDETDAIKLADKFRDKGEDFDRDYLGRMVKDHDKVIRLIGTRSNDLKADFQAMLNEMLPTLRKHRSEAKLLLDAVKERRPAAARTPRPER